MLKTLLNLLAADQIAVPIKAVFRLDQIREAHRESANSEGLGSIILAVSNQEGRISPPDVVRGAR